MPPLSDDLAQKGHLQNLQTLVTSVHRDWRLPVAPGSGSGLSALVLDGEIPPRFRTSTSFSFPSENAVWAMKPLVIWEGECC